MARPATKTPRSAPPAAPTRPTLAAAPDNGVHVVDAPTTKPPAPAPARSQPSPGAGAGDPMRVRDFRQVSTRVPPELLERLQRCCDETGASKSRLVIRALEQELTARGF